MSKKKAVAYQLPPEKKITALLAHGRRTHKQVQSLSGDFGQAVANAVENHHVDRKAFSIIRGLDRMDDSKLARTWHHLQIYFDQCGLQKRIDDAPELELEEEKAEKDDEKKVVPIREAAE